MVVMLSHRKLFLAAAISASIALSGVFLAAQAASTSPAPEVPFYSQFKDIQSPKWQKVGCGIASLAMLIDFYKPGTVSVNNLLKAGLAAGAFINGAGWSHQGLASLAHSYGLSGASYDWSRLNAKAALSQFDELLKAGPVIASVHYKFDPKNPIPHLVVINDISDGIIHYNDPASAAGGKNISVQDFMKAWKKRLIVVRT